MGQAPSPPGVPTKATFAHVHYKTYTRIFLAIPFVVEGRGNSLMCINKRIVEPCSGSHNAAVGTEDECHSYSVACERK